MLETHDGYTSYFSFLLAALTITSVLFIGVNKIQLI